MKKKTLLLFAAFALAIAVFFPISAEAKVKISKKTITMTVGQTKKLKIKGTKKKVTWKSKNKSVASVNKKGKVTALKSGKATIVAKVGKKKFKCKVTVKVSSTSSGSGTRENPYVLSNGCTFTYMDDYPKVSRTVKLQLVETIENADQIVSEENMFNETSDGSNRWVLYHYKLDYLSGSGEINAYDIISTYYFYDSTSTVNLSGYIDDTATFSGSRSGLGIYDVKLYPGGSSDVWLGILLDNSISYTTFKLTWYDTSYTSHEIWFRN